MGLAHNPRIVTDGLVLCLDAANPKSYPGSGTTWSDLSKNGNDGTLVNGVGYSSDNKGKMSFDGSNDLIDVNNFSITSEYTVSIIIKFNSLGSNKAIVDFGNLSGAFRLYLQSSKIKVQHDSAFAATGVFSTFIPETTIHYHITVTYSNGTCSLYSNSNLNATGSLSAVSTSHNRIGIGDHPIGSSSGMGVGSFSLSSLQIYNRALTESEIQQNFAATRGRYGI